jgi:arylsulfatase A-like enzyme
VIRDDHYKYVHFADLPALLFDLQADPGELHDIAGERPDIVAQYAQKLLSWRLRTTDKTLSHYQLVRGEGLQTRGTSSVT